MKTCPSCGRETTEQEACPHCWADLKSVPDIEAVNAASKTLAEVTTRFYESMDGVPSQLRDQLTIAYFNFLLKGVADASSGASSTFGKSI